MCSGSRIKQKSDFEMCSKIHEKLEEIEERLPDLQTDKTQRRLIKTLKNILREGTKEYEFSAGVSLRGRLLAALQSDAKKWKEVDGRLREMNQIRFLRKSTNLTLNLG